MKVSSFLEEKLMPIADKIGKQKHLLAIRDGMVAIIPLTIIGGISLIVAFPPIDPTVTKPSNFFINLLLAWANWSSKNIDTILAPFNMTMAIMAIFVAASISYSLAKSYKMDGLSSAIISMVTFLMVSSSSKSVVLLENVKKGGDALNQTITALPSDYFDAKGLFAAILVGILTVEITRFVSSKGFSIKMPEGVPPAVAKSFESLIPMISNVAIFYAISLILTSTTGMNLPQAVMKILAPAIGGVNTLWGMLLLVLICQVFWLMGIHGTNIIGIVITPVAISNLLENATARTTGQALPQIFADPFWMFITIGGSGATFGLVLLYLRSKSKQLRMVGKLSIGPAFFNIGEPLIFGSPIVMNPVMAIPFIAAPIVNVIITFICMRTNLVGRPFAAVPWTTPSVIAGGLSTMDIKAALLVIILIAIDTVIYLPFFKVFEKIKIKEERELEGK